MHFFDRLSGVVRKNAVNVYACIGKLFDIRAGRLARISDLLQVLRHAAQLFIAAAGSRNCITQCKNGSAGTFGIYAGRNKQFVCFYQTGSIKRCFGSVLFDLVQKSNGFCFAAQHIGQCCLVLFQLRIVLHTGRHDLLSGFNDFPRNCAEQICRNASLCDCRLQPVKHTATGICVFKAVQASFCVICFRRKLPKAVFGIAQAAF